MDDFRKSSPQRRTNISNRNKYVDYKPELREDFHQRCGYCGDHDFFRETYYEIDHFIPTSLEKSGLNIYTNLVYSCRSCNNSKRGKWPTGNPQKANDGVEGWIDPCDPLYSHQFERLSDGSIRAISKLGEWMWSALNLGNPSHRLTWKLEEIKNLLAQTDNMDINDPIELRNIKELNTKYRKFEEDLRGIPSFI